MSQLKDKKITCKEVIDAKLDNEVCAYDCSRPKQISIECKVDKCACPVVQR